LEAKKAKMTDAEKIAKIDKHIADMKGKLEKMACKDKCPGDAAKAAVPATPATPAAPAAKE
jgi:hypothetical protein